MLAKLLSALGLRSQDAKSSAIAKERLQVVLIGDRAQIPHEVIEKMKADIIEVIKRHVAIEEADMDVQIAMDENKRSSALVANIPLKAFGR